MEIDVMKLYEPIQAANDANNAWSAQQAQKAMDWQERMSSSAHQREVKDLLAAGLNPVLSAGGQGATTGTGHAADASGQNVAALYGLVSKALDAQLAQAAAMQTTATKIANPGVKADPSLGAGAVSAILANPALRSLNKDDADDSLIAINNKGYVETGNPGADAAVNAVQDLLYKYLGIYRNTSAKVVKAVIEVGADLTDGDVSARDLASAGLVGAAPAKAIKDKSLPAALAGLLGFTPTTALKAAYSEK